MNLGGLVGALLPVFFVLALAYMAGKRNPFDADQAAGLSRLALSFALPASLFVSMTDIRKVLLLQQVYRSWQRWLCGTLYTWSRGIPQRTRQRVMAERKVAVKIVLIGSL